jgi:citrate lyase subunit beta/citryl-CoA lyase
VEKATTLDADIVFLDLEDAVAPRQKEAARARAIEAMTSLDWGDTLLGCRVNGLHTPYFYRDVIEVVEGAGARLDLLIVPKVRRPEDLYVADTLLTQIEHYKGFEPGRIKLQALIETPEALLAAPEIARSTPRVHSLGFGPGDLGGALRMPIAAIGSSDEWDRRYPGHRFHFAMALTVAAARAAGIGVLDGPVADVRDPAAFRESCLVARSLGFDGKWCIHPGQIPIANEVFSPTAEELAWARRVVEAYAAATAEGRGAIELDGKLIDDASIRLAEVALAMAGYSPHPPTPSPSVGRGGDS